MENIAATQKYVKIRMYFKLIKRLELKKYYSYAKILNNILYLFVRKYDKDL